MRREVPLFITFLFGTFMIIQYFIPQYFVTDLADRFQRWAIIILAFAYVLGVANVVRISGERVYQRGLDWPYKILTIVALFFMGILGLVTGVGEGTFFNDRMYVSVYSPMQATMYSTLAFYIASAAYRAFRVRTWQAGLLAVTAVVVMLGRVPIGAAIWGGFPGLVEWIMGVPNVVGQRAILIGAALGAVATGLKMVLGIERSYLGGGD